MRLFPLHIVVGRLEWWKHVRAFCLLVLAGIRNWDAHVSSCFMLLRSWFEGIMQCLPRSGCKESDTSHYHRKRDHAILIPWNCREPDLACSENRSWCEFDRYIAKSLAFSLHNALAQLWWQDRFMFTCSGALISQNVDWYSLTVAVIAVILRKLRDRKGWTLPATPCFLNAMCM